jgi:3-dehydroquinate dehydratase type I
VICTSLREESIRAVRAALTRCAFAEIRLEALRAKPDEIAALFGCGKKLIATMRPGHHSDEARAERLGTAIRAGAAYVDVELDAPPELRREVVGTARRARCRVIVSHHDERETPPRERLEKLTERCFGAGADIAKIACRTEDAADAARLIGLLSTGGRVIPVGMGPWGKQARIAALLLGAPFMYAARTERSATASGQPTATVLAAAYLEVQHASR